jgi:Domain of unknown function (DUF3854)
MEEADSPHLILSFFREKPLSALRRRSDPMQPDSNVESFTRETPSAYSRANTSLQPHHLQALQDPATSPAVSRARGYQTVTRKSALRGYGFSPEQCRTPALLIPVYDAGGRLITYQIRTDEPRIDRSVGAVEYEVCAGRQFALDVPPASAPLLLDPCIPLYITDEVFKADSAASHGLCCVDLVGLWATADESDVMKRLNPGDWDGIVLDHRIVRFVYDADSTHRAQTRNAFATLQQFLWSRQARIQRINL